MNKGRNGIGPDDPRVTAPAVVPAGSIRIVSNLRLQNLDDEGVTVLMLGDEQPELACVLTPAQSRQIVATLLEHVQRLEAHEAAPQEESSP
jgi:hypothetical protein